MMLSIRERIARARQIDAGSGRRGYLGIGKRDDTRVEIT